MAVVSTTHGKVRGVTLNGVHVFRGLRYADDAGGSNRFRSPQPLRSWAGVYDAVSNAPSCPQLPRPENTDPFFSWYSALEPIGEDCLAVNLFTPSLGIGKRPILFWIHGGGWREYSGTAPGFDGSTLALTEDVVVVSVNHRLGVFGFLKLDGDDENFADSGNAGLLDIVAALEWVRANAEAFGGDPNNITLFGESGGASKIAALLSMRRAKGLFHKAIMQSSGGGMRLATPDDARTMNRRLAKSLGLQMLEPHRMQALSVPAILDAIRSVPGNFRGMIDGRSFTDHPFDGSAPATAAGIPLMAGCTRTEATYYMRDDDRNFALGWHDTHRRLKAFLEADDATMDRILDAYRAEYPAESPSNILFLAASDFIFKRNTWDMAAWQAAQAPTWAFHFEWTSPIEGGRMGAPHTAEVPFIFGTTTAAVGCVGEGPETEPMSRMMMATWAAFARTGNPDNDLLPHWPRYDDANRQMMALDCPPRVVRDPGGTARAALEVLPRFSYRNNIGAIVAG